MPHPLEARTVVFRWVSASGAVVIPHRAGPDIAVDLLSIGYGGLVNSLTRGEARPLKAQGQACAP